MGILINYFKMDQKFLSDEENQLQILEEHIQAV